MVESKKKNLAYSTINPDPAFPIYIHRLFSGSARKKCTSRI
jgi:hypothetical protein